MCAAPCAQEWIDAAVGTAVRDGAVDRDELAAGVPGAYKAVHALAVESLVTVRIDRLSVDTAPETLSMDVSRILFFRADYHDLAVRAAILAVLGTALVGDAVSPNARKKDAVRAFGALLNDDAEGFTALVAAPARDRFRELLDESSVLADPTARGAFLNSVVRVIESSADPVRRIM